MVRLLLIPWGFHDDVITNCWWGKFATEFPLRGYYDWLEFGGYHDPDLPPLHILYHREIREVYLFLYKPLWWVNVNVPVFPSKLMQWYFENGNQVVSKIPSIVADLLIILLVVKIVPEIKRRKGWLWLLALLPPLIYNSALWGGNDSVLNLMGWGAVYALMRKRYGLFGVLITAGILFKPTWLVYGLVMLIILLKNKGKLEEWGRMVAGGLVTAYVCAKPFAVGWTMPWLITTYGNKFLPGVMSHLTANAANLWSLLYGMEPIPDSIVVGGLVTARQLSLILFFGLLGVILVNLWRNYSEEKVWLTIVNVTMVSFCLLTRMHERYTYPALIPLFILTVKNKKYTKYLLVLMVTHMLNVYRGWWVPEIGWLRWLLMQEVVVRGLAVVNLGLMAGLLREQLGKKKVV